MNTYGRKTLFCSLEEDELNEKNILKALETLIPLHESNKAATKYLKGYYRGEQDIYLKVKHTREEINNITVENWAYAITEFMKSFILNEPIQYVQLNDESSEELSALNKYLAYENKDHKDIELLEDIVLCGRGYRYVAPDGITEDDETPFELYNIDAEHCEVVYHSGIEKKQLFAFVETPMQKVVTKVVDGKSEKEYEEYYIYTVYTKNRVYKFTSESKNLRYLDKNIEKSVLYPEGHRIIEYYFNRDRFSIIEVVKPLLDKINLLESLDMDDMEQFVNSLGETRDKTF